MTYPVPCSRVDRSAFPVELRAWTVRGLVSALPSFGWALFAGYTRWFELVAMLAGTGVWILAFAVLSSLERWRSSERLNGWLDALRSAVVPRTVCALLAVPLGLLALETKSSLLAPVLFVAFADMMTGWGALALAALAANGLGRFPVAFCATVVQGALIVAELGVIALVVRAYRSRGS